MAAGCHVLVEKPVGVSSAGLDAVADEAEARGLVAAAAHQFRFEPGLVRLREILAAGDLGTLLAVEAHQGEHLADYHPDEDYRVGYAARREPRRGRAAHPDPPHRRARLAVRSARTGSTRLGGHRTDLDLDVEDTASYLFRTSDGAGVHGHLDYRQRPKRVTLAVVGSDGRADWDHYAGTLAVSRFAPGAGPVVQRWDYDRDAMFRGSGRTSSRAIRTGTSATDVPAGRHPGRTPRRGHRALAGRRRRGGRRRGSGRVDPSWRVTTRAALPSFAERNGRNFGMDHVVLPAGGTHDSCST